MIFLYLTRVCRNSDSYEKKEVGTHRRKVYSNNADNLLKTYTSKLNKHVVNKKLQHTDHLFLCVSCFTLFGHYLQNMPYGIPK